MLVRRTVPATARAFTVRRSLKPIGQLKRKFTGGNVLVQMKSGKRRRRKHVMRGGDFWSDFGNGFVKGFTKVMDIGNQLAPLAKFL